MSVRRLLHGMGYRYRTHVPGMPGKPDLVFPGPRKVVFVHGCFWHGHTFAIRRESRRLRRTTRRRARRMAAIRALQVEEKLLVSADPAEFHHRKGCESLDPWRLRAEALDRRLDDEELAAALLDVAKHRGFRSNRKSGGSDESGDDKKMRSGVHENRELRSRSRYRTVGEMVVHDEKFESSKRNKAGEYARTHSRGELESLLDPQSFQPGTSSFTTGRTSNSIAPPPWPSGVNLQPESPRFVGSTGPIKLV